MKLEQRHESLTSINHNMNETHGFRKQYNICINEIKSFHLRVVFGYVTWILRAFSKAKWLIKSLKVGNQWRAEVWWCVGRLLDCMPPYQILVLSSSVWRSLLLDIRCLQGIIWSHICICKPTFCRSLLTQSAYYSASTLLSRCCTMCHCNEHKLSALQVKRPQ